MSNFAIFVVAVLYLSVGRSYWCKAESLRLLRLHLLCSWF